MDWTTKPLPAINQEGISNARYIIAWVVMASSFAFLGYMALRGDV